MTERITQSLGSRLTSQPEANAKLSPKATVLIVHNYGQLKVDWKSLSIIDKLPFLVFS